MTISHSAVDDAVEYAERRAGTTMRCAEVWMDVNGVHVSSIAPLGAWVFYVATPPRTLADLVRG